MSDDDDKKINEEITKKWFKDKDLQYTENGALKFQKSGCFAALKFSYAMDQFVEIFKDTFRK